MLGVNDYTTICEYQNNVLKKDFQYNGEKDSVVCTRGKHLEFKKLIYKKSPKIIMDYTAFLKRNEKNIPVFQLGQQIRKLLGSMPGILPIFLSKWSKS